MKHQAKFSESQNSLKQNVQDSQVDRLREEITNSRLKDERANEERKERSLKELARATA